MAGLKQENIEFLEYYARSKDRANYWRYLATLSGGDGYAKLALSVVRNDNIAGSTANAYAHAYAKNQGITMDARDWEDFGVELMKSDFSARQKYFNQGDYSNALNIPVQDIENYHGADFKKYQISPNAWTP